MLSVVIFLMILTLYNCRLDEKDENPIPILTSISPSSKAVNMPSFTLTARGSGFIADSRIVYNDVELTTNFINSNTVSARISSNKIKKNVNNVSGLNGKIHSVFIRNPEPGGGDSASLKLSITYNHTFPGPLEIFETGHSYGNPVIAVDGKNKIYIIFENYNYQNKIYNISVIKSVDYGKTWSKPQHLVEFDRKCYNPAIAIGSDGNVYVTFYVIKLYFMYLKNGESKWSPPRELTSDTNIPLKSALSVDRNNKVDIIWSQSDNNYNNKIYYTNTMSSSMNFSTPVNIFKGWENYSLVSDLAISSDGDGNVYATWTSWPSGGSKYSHSVFNYSNDEGVTWGSPDKVFSVCSSSDMDVDPDGNIGLIVSSSYLPFRNQIVFYKSIDNGQSFGSTVKITGGFNDYNPKISIDSVSNINVIFKLNKRYYYCRSINKGKKWAAPFSIGNIGGGADIALDKEGNVYVVSGHYSKLFFLRNSTD